MNILWQWSCIFFINFVADTLILLLVRQELFSEKSVFRTLKGGCLTSITYILWYCLTPYFTKTIRFLLAAFSVGITLILTFQIRSFRLWIQTVCIMMLYVFLMGGFVLMVIRFDGDRELDKMYWLVIPVFLFLFSFGITFMSRKRAVTCRREENYYEVKIFRAEAQITVTGYYDTGNRMYSHMTGEGISVLDRQSGVKLLSEKERFFLQNAWQENTVTVESIFESGCSGIYPVRFQTVGQSENIMAGILADRIIVQKNGKVFADKKGMLGINAEHVSKDERFSVLLPEDIFS